MSITEEAPGFMQVFSDGSVKRFAPEIASTSDGLGFKSKDVVIDASKPITARIFLPRDAGETPLSVVLYFHGGGFCIGSTTWLGYHWFLGDLSAAAHCVVVSIDYRLAPEARLPAAYDDCYASLQWLRANPEPWLASADLSRVFLVGDSAGGNIAHNVAVRDTKIAGLMLIHPYFGSEERTERETSAVEDDAVAVSLNDMFWRLSVPVDSNRDYAGCNFETLSARPAWQEFPAVVVFVAGQDFLKERGVMYARFLERKGVGDVRVVEATDEGHVFHVFHPESEATRLLQKQMREFMDSIISC